MDSEDIMLSETSDTERQILYDITYMWNLKIRQTSKYNKKETLRNRKEISGYQVGRGKGRGARQGSGIKIRIGNGIYTILYKIDQLPGLYKYSQYVTISINEV